MRLSRRMIRGQPRRLLAGLILFAYVTAAFGIPLPVPVSKDRSQRFPCENHMCGCQSAEECWRRCCCMSVEERWAWARANRIEPPAYAERVAEDHPHSACGCQHRETGPASPPRAASCRHASPPRNAPPRSRGGWVSGLAALKCTGVSTLWIGSGAVLPLSFAVSFSGPVATGWVCQGDISMDRHALPPADPPPRRQPV